MLTEMAKTDVGIPPVVLRTTCIGSAIVNVGQSLAGLGALLLLDIPFAMVSVMDGSPLMMKLPQMPKCCHFF